MFKGRNSFKANKHDCLCRAEHFDSLLVVLHNVWRSRKSANNIQKRSSKRKWGKILAFPFNYFLNISDSFAYYRELLLQLLSCYSFFTGCQHYFDRLFWFWFWHFTRELVADDIFPRYTVQKSCLISKPITEFESFLLFPASRVRWFGSSRKCGNACRGVSCTVQMLLTIMLSKLFYFWSHKKSN